MGIYRGAALLAPVGSTGNNTHGGALLPEDAKTFAAKFVVEAIGATPTVTFKFQVSVDAATVSDANAAWFDLLYLTMTNDTPATATIPVASVGSTLLFPSLPASRQFRRIRLVTTANTNVTYRAEVYSADDE